MSREAYMPPTVASNNAITSPFTTANQTGALTQYQCGECAAKVKLHKGDPIRCKECGHRVLYKERTKRMVQFEAR